MYYIYILLMKDNNFYTGYSNNLKERITNHNLGKVDTTKNKRPLKLIHYEAYIEKFDAKRREKFLKSSDGKRFLKQQITIAYNKYHK